MVSRKDIEDISDKGVKYIKDKTGVSFPDGVTIYFHPNFNIKSINNSLSVKGYGSTSDNLFQLDLNGAVIDIDTLELYESKILNFKSNNKSMKRVVLSSVDDISILSNFEYIEKLIISFYDGDLSLIKNIKINNIEINGCDGLVNIKPISHIPQIRIVKCNNFNSLNGITENVSELSLESCVKLKNLKFLPSTTNIFLRHCDISTLKGFVLNIDVIAQQKDTKYIIHNIVETIVTLLLKNDNATLQDVTFVCSDYKKLSELFEPFGTESIIRDYFTISYFPDKINETDIDFFKHEVVNYYGVELLSKFESELEI